MAKGLPDRVADDRRRREQYGERGGKHPPAVNGEEREDRDHRHGDRGEEDQEEREAVHGGKVGRADEPAMRHAHGTGRTSAVAPLVMRQFVEGGW